MKAIDRTKAFKSYKGLWVGFGDDEETVVCSGKTLKEALEEGQKKGYPHPIMAFMHPNLDKTLIGAVLI